MKNYFFMGILSLFIFISCSETELEEPNYQQENKQEITTITVGSISEEDKTPCDFDFNNTIENDTLNIVCSHDLKGENVFLPRGVIINYYGGKIKNGSLFFDEGGKIDGRLLNHQLDVSGKVSLIDPTFVLIKENWNITEGTVSDAIALNNRKSLQKVIDDIKRLRGKTLKINSLNAFFNIEHEYGFPSMALSIPSDFELIMSTNTTLRVQPNNKPSGNLINIKEKTNVRIIGGTLIGDRYEHNYEPYFDQHGIPRSSHEWPGLLVIQGSENITIENMELHSSTGDCLIIGSAGHRINPETLWNKNIDIKNNLIHKGRRNNITISDGEDILIENNRIVDCGHGDILKDSNGNTIYNSAGVAPRYGIDIEPFVGYDDITYESIRKFEWVENVIIKSNTFEGNKAGSIIVYKGNGVLIENNISDHVIAQNMTLNSKIINNTLKANESLDTYCGIMMSDYSMFTDFKGGNLKQYAEGNDVIGNTIEGFIKGIVVNGKNAIVKDNNLKNCEISLQIGNAENIEINNNVYKSDQSNSNGILLTGVANNISINNEEFDITGHFINAYNFNTGSNKFTNDISNYSISVSNCNLYSTRASKIRNSNGILLKENNINVPLEVTNSNRITLDSNHQNITSINWHGMTLDGSTNCNILNNYILVADGYKRVIIKNEVSNANNIVTGN